MKLYFMRHGQASHNAPTDSQRPLTPKGTKQVTQMAQAVARMGAKPNHIYASPRLRAQQTAQALAVALDQPVETRDECNFDFNLDAVAALTKDLGEDEEAFFVGHNPSMTEVVAALTGAQVDFKPGSVACTFAYVPRSRGGVLQWFLTPKKLEAILK